jgi:hypothetical protein
VPEPIILVAHFTVDPGGVFLLKEPTDKTKQTADPMSISDALAAFAESPTTTVTILDSDVWGLRYPFGLSIHRFRKTPKRLSLSKQANVHVDRALSLSKKAISAIYPFYDSSQWEFDVAFDCTHGYKCNSKHHRRQVVARKSCLRRNSLRPVISGVRLI